MNNPELLLFDTEKIWPMFVLKIINRKLLIKEFGLMFFETSAFTGQGIKDCMETIAMLFYFKF